MFFCILYLTTIIIYKWERVGNSDTNAHSACESSSIDWQAITSQRKPETSKTWKIQEKAFS